MLYLIYFAIGLLGLSFQIVLKIQTLQSLAKKANVCFKVSQFFSDNVWSIVLSILAIIVVMVFYSEIEVHYPAIKGWARAFFALWGYCGASLLTHAFDAAGTRLTAAIDDKTTQIDKINNTLDAPTPATKP